MKPSAFILAGLVVLDDNSGGELEYECPECGAAVSETASACSVCGIQFEVEAKGKEKVTIEADCTEIPPPPPTSEPQTQDALPPPPTFESQSQDPPPPTTFESQSQDPPPPTTFDSQTHDPPPPPSAQPPPPQNEPQLSQNRCSDCQNEMTWEPQANRWYCAKCNKVQFPKIEAT